MLLLSFIAPIIVFSPECGFFVLPLSSVCPWYKVKWIEAAAACPIFTALITYYAEGDRGLPVELRCVHSACVSNV